MSTNYIIFKENDLYGAKNNDGDIVIVPQYIEMYPFSCGLSMVRNTKYEYAYINEYNQQVIPFGRYCWCDNLFLCGYARVVRYDSLEEKNKWGMIDTSGRLVIPLEYDKIWALKEGYLNKIKAFKDGKEQEVNLFIHSLKNGVLLDGLSYIVSYSIEEFKKRFHCSRIDVVSSNTGKLYFTYGCNIGYVAINAVPKTPIISIVINSAGKLFPLLHEKDDIGRTSFDLNMIWGKPQKIQIRKQYSKKTSFGDYEKENMNKCENWSDPYSEDQVYYDGWNSEDVESGFSDAFEDDVDALWNID